MVSQQPYHDCLEYYGPNLSDPFPFQDDNFLPPSVVVNMIMAA
jgi:hypothetical protein